MLHDAEENLPPPDQVASAIVAAVLSRLTTTNLTAIVACLLASWAGHYGYTFYSQAQGGKHALEHTSRASLAVYSTRDPLPSLPVTPPLISPTSCFAPSVLVSPYVHVAARQAEEERHVRIAAVEQRIKASREQASAAVGWGR